LPTVKPYYPFRDELSVEDGIVYRGTRTVIPTAMITETLESLHSSHMGINATLRRAILTVYWLGMSKDITEKCQRCMVCLKDSDKQQREENQAHSVPVRPWSKIGVDLSEFNQKHYF
jgi:hypothetical protein